MKTKTIKLFLFLFISINSYAQKDTIKTPDSTQVLEWRPQPFKNSTPKIKKEEKHALKQFVDFCKLQVKIDNLYKDNAGISVIILNALGFDTGALIVKQSEIDNKLNNVLKYDDNRKSFLTFFAKVGNNDYQRIYCMVKPATNNYYRSKIEISAKDAEILTNYIIKEYYHIDSETIDADSETITEKPIKYTAVSKKAVFKGGEQNYIYSKVEFPEVKDLEKKFQKL